MIFCGGCLLNSRNSFGPAVFWHVLAWSKSKWCIWRIVDFVYEEIFLVLDDRDELFLPIIMQSLLWNNKKTTRLVVTWLHKNTEALNKHTVISWTTTKDCNRTKLLLPLSLARGSHFPVLFIWREYDSGSFLNGLMWSFSMMETFYGYEGIFTRLGDIGDPMNRTMRFFFSRGCWRAKSGIRCWIVVIVLLLLSWKESEKSCLLMVGMRFLCYQRTRSHL